GLGPFALQLGLAAFLVDGGQGGLQDVGRGGAEGTLAAPVEVGRRCRQGQDGGGLFHCVGRVAEVVFGQGGGLEFLLRRAFPQESRIQRGRQGLGRGQKILGGRLLEGEQHGVALDLAALAAGRFDLQRGVGFGKNG